MPIYFGDKEIGDVLDGVGSVFYGDKEVWTKDTWYLKYLGTVTSFDVKTLGVDVSKLTTSNFVARSQGTSVQGYCERVYSSSATSYVGWSIEKSFSNGVINFNYHCLSRNTDTRTAMPLFLISQQKVDGATKIKGKNRIYLGFGQGFNVASKYADYKNLTANNFYFTGGGTVAVEEGPSVDGAGPVSGSAYVYKSYNSSNGQLSFYNTSGAQTAGVYALLIV